jgi:hypothetical protein
VLVEDACVDRTFAIDLVRGDEAEGSELQINQSVYLEARQVELTRY